MDACREDIRELSSIYDKESMDTFVTLYFDGEDSSFIPRRVRKIRSVLRGDELKNFDKTMEQLEKSVSDKFDVAVFASHKNNYFKTIDLPVKPGNALIVDTSPYIRPLTELYDEWSDYDLVLLSTNHARIFSVSCGEVSEQDDVTADIISKHKKGGWSQPRFQRLREESIQAFFTEVINELKETDGPIILAGPGQAKKEFLDMLPQKLAVSVVAVVDADFDDQHELIQESQEIIAERNEEQLSQLMKHIKKEILREGLAIYGVEDTLEAVKRGQVEVLVVDTNFRAKGWICEHCQVVEKGSSTTCPYCGNRTSEVDIAEELIEFAERTGARVDFTENEEIRDLGHIAALLRYRD
ncbi:MAG: Vms1/Ankzf1 family peptidyl-tRNA hydrolase [Archaeoglobaceae archaeon]